MNLWSGGGGGGGGRGRGMEDGGGRVGGGGGKLSSVSRVLHKVLDESGSSFYFRLSSFMTSRTLIQLDNQR